MVAVKCQVLPPLWRQQIFHYSLLPVTLNIGESKLGRLVDALALGGEEGRDKLR